MILKSKQLALGVRIQPDRSCFLGVEEVHLHPLLLARDLAYAVLCGPSPLKGPEPPQEQEVHKYICLPS